MKHNVNYKRVLSAAHLPPLQAGRYAPTCSYTFYAVAYIPELLFCNTVSCDSRFKKGKGEIIKRSALTIFLMLNQDQQTTNRSTRSAEKSIRIAVPG